MAEREFSWSGAGLRFLFALILVFATYNPEGWSYYHWAIEAMTKGVAPLDFGNLFNDFGRWIGAVWDNVRANGALKAFAGIILIIGWTIYLRSTLLSLGILGILLAAAFFGTLIWLIVDWGLIPTDSVRSVTYIILVALAAVLAVGMSWSHVRRRLSGQRDVDDVETD